MKAERKPVPTTLIFHPVKRITFEISKEDKDLIREAARAERRTMSSFMRMAGIDRAKDVLEGAE